MALSDLLIRIGVSYQGAKLERFTDHPLAIVIRQAWPREVKNLLGETIGQLQCKASAGQSKWTDSPWAAIFDPIITTGAESGYYPVYLFSKDFTGVSLVMGQGTNSVREEFGRGTQEILAMRAGLLRQRVPEFRKRFTEGPFSIKASANAGSDWDVSSAWGKTYSLSKIPDDKELGADLREMAALYRLATKRGGVDLSENLDSSAPIVEGSNSKAQLEGARRERFHLRIERQRNNNLVKDAKRIHGHLCQACGFSFGSIYGSDCADYIEAHHLTPLYLLEDDAPILTDPRTDFAVLCANCHRMIHRKGCPSLEEFKSSLSKPEAS
jgi:5-methylcytosine-specific restriction protein A